MPTPVIPISFSMPAELHERTTAAAYDAHISRNKWIVKAVEEKLQREAKK